MKFHEDQYVGYDGTRMYMCAWLPDDDKPRALLIAIHGLGSHGQTMKNIGEYFSQRGLAVLAPDMRGFGHYTGRKGHVISFDEYVEDLQNIVMQAKDKYPNRLTYLFGHSMGALHVIRYVAVYPESVDGIVISCPGLAERLPVGRMTRLAARVLSLMDVKRYVQTKLDFSLASHDPEVVRAHENDPLRFDKVTPRLGISGLDAAKKAMRLAKFIRTPALIQQAGDDRVVVAEKAKEFHDNLASQDKEWKLYEGLYHEIHAEIGKERVLEDMEAWLEKRLVS
ncbi:MAG: lysophospholipase [Candidatus Thorarchaeota archaeon]|nr:lysophospholipase [Candidatus Thorarchaeota archaeon]